MDVHSQALLSVSIIDKEQEFLGLAEGWNSLVKKIDGSVFFRHEWFGAAWAWRKDNSSLFVLTAQKGNDLVGILPLIHIHNKGQFPRLRSLEFLAVPDTQVCDLIVSPENRKMVADTFCEELHTRRKEWDRLSFRYLDEATSAIREIKAGLEARRYPCNLKTQGPNLFIKLDTSWDAYYSTRTRSLKKANNLAANRLKKTGQIAIHWISRENSDESVIQSALEQAIDISRRSWKQGTGNSLDQPGPRAFISTLTAHAARNGWLSLWLLSIDEKILAMEYQLLDAGKVYALRADFDADCEEISPGSHLMRTLLETLFGRGLQRYYMGPGENAYKTRWTEDSDMLQQMIVYGSTWRGKFARVLDETMKPFARSLRDKLTSKKAQSASRSQHGSTE